MNILHKKLFNTKEDNEQGLGIIEIVVVVAILVTAFVAILQVAFLERRAQIYAKEHTAAYVLARSSMEITRDIRDDEWADLSALSYGTAYYFTTSGSEWQFTASNPGPVNGYTRWIEVSEVFRDGSNNISSSGTSDPDTRKVTAYVSWTGVGGETETVSVSTYLTNWNE